ncbi:CRISPR-associated helicase/endonuclease Cas3 [Candidatus Desantisbacteria bacterium CG_4_8_14_3_um_filter_40_12]|uniref:CRISPR-associated helicase/endonuclease Cas3 n=2 Tax=unclassified Candidatus Desantisiibacteriota TaxID=3106372 RepID=A0A2M7JED7_9BACT|nr:MAG: CRISPR-associated helicase/endonuclease Cas3 [Candidatus Desantisbacteria bacterium CG23_combo_of_CG06-09_8_20_14_all_40_23]PIX17774.1 MAG: CRISPR-associated helicase/endonuclease Cas3 [Candidatus Desantisbacteria bacterium CG_4_8_14_3_um_filter_40_12]
MFRNNDYIAHCREKDGEIQSLVNHLEEVSKTTGEFASKIGLKEQGELIGLLHDFGKASQEFEKYIKSAVGIINSDEDDYVDAAGKKGKVDHSTAGAQLIYRNLADKGDEAMFVAQILSICIVSHHSGLLDCISPEGVDGYSKRMATMEEKSHINEVLSKISDRAKAKITDMIESKDLLQNIVNRLNALKTSIDSKETLVFKYGLLLRFLYSCLIDADRLDTADFEMPRLAKLRNHGNYADWSVLVNRLNEKLADFKPEGINTVRQKISQACYDFSDKPKGLYQLTVPTGGRKTFSSLRFALHHADKYKMDRIIYVLPYTTIIDQNADEIRKILEEKDKKGKYLNRIVLEHHSNLMPDEETARQKVLSENWDAPVVLTTNVQFLEALFGFGTRGARKMHQLANAVIIFDEVQTLPVKCVQLFNTAVNFLVNNCGSTVVLCTATQPLLDKIEPKSRALPITAGQQMVSDARQLFDDLNRVEIYDKIKVGGWSNDEIKDLVGERVVKSSSVLVVVNTKTSACEIYQQCKQINNIETYHLSTHMCPAHRMVVLDRIKASLHDKKPVICVSTQLIEAGVDISFGSVIRFLAGLDSIVQAAGRCNRHNEMYPALGKVYIINPTEENIDRIEDIRIGKEKSERLLDEFRDNPGRFGNNILSPEAMEQYYQYYFYQRAKEMNYPVSSKSAVGQEDNLFNLLSVNKISVEEYNRINKKAPAIPLKQAFMSAAKSFEAIETVARGIIVPYEKEGKDIVNEICSAYELKKQYKLIRRAQRYSVNVFPNILKRLQERGAVNEVQEGSGILYLNKQYYSDEFGLSEMSVKDMGFLGA